MLTQNCIHFSNYIVEDDGHVYPRDIDFNQGDRCRKGEIYNYNKSQVKYLLKAGDIYSHGNREEDSTLSLKYSRFADFNYQSYLVFISPIL